MVSWCAVRLWRCGGVWSCGARSYLPLEGAADRPKQMHSVHPSSVHHPPQLRVETRAFSLHVHDWSVRSPRRFGRDRTHQGIGGECVCLWRAELGLAVSG